MTPPFSTRLCCFLGEHSFGDPLEHEYTTLDLRCLHCPKKMKWAREQFVDVSPRWSLWERIRFLLGR